MDKNNTLSILLINYNTAQFTINCIDSIKNSVTENIEIVVIDNHSLQENPGSIQDKHPDIKFIQNSKNDGFSKGNNIAAKHATGEWLIILNNDTLLAEDTMIKIQEYLKNLDKKTILTGKIQNLDGSFQYTGGKEPTLLYELIRFAFFQVRYIPNKYTDQFLANSSLIHEQTELDWATGCFFVMHRNLYEELGGFDNHIFMYLDDVDIHKRARKKGAKIILFPDILITHFGKASSKLIKEKAVCIQYKSTVYYFSKHFGFLYSRTFLVVTKMFFIFWMIVYALLEIFIQFGLPLKSKLRLFIKLAFC